MHTMHTDSLPAVLARIRHAWATRRCCGLTASAMGIRVLRIIELVDDGFLADEKALGLALEAEAIALCAAPLPMRKADRVSL